MKQYIIAFFCCVYITAVGQNDRVTDHNTIGWLQSFATVQLHKNFDWLAEVQWRRTGGFNDAQQLLLRTSVQYRFNSQISAAAGYAWIETYPYGDYPIAANGAFPERRLHQQIIWKQALHKLAVSQRLRTEQRWIGRIATADQDKIEDWVFSNRFRYQLRLQRLISDSGRVQLYGALANEIFINAGKNVGANIFDQNRIQALVGVKLTPCLGIEGGYMKQTVLQGRRTTNGNSVIQNNDGATLALLIQL